MKRILGFSLKRLLPLSLLLVVAVQLWPHAHRWLLTSTHFQIDRVLVAGNRFLTPEEVVSIAGIHPGAPMIALRPGAAEGRLRLHPRVKHASISYVFPRGIRVWVDERRALALVEEGALVAVSGDGVVLPPVEGRPLDALPIVLPPAGSEREGHFVRAPEVLEALSFLEEMHAVDERLASTISLVDLSGERFARVYVDSLDTALVYEVGGAWSAHVRALPAVIADLEREHVYGAVLDLRFREQIVRRGGALAQAIIEDNS